MPLYTSNFSVMTRLPKLPYGRFCFVLIVLVVAQLICLELSLRGAGHMPSVSDSPNVWAIQRHRLDKNNTSNFIVILGASRVLLGLDPKAIQAETPGDEVVILAVDGCSCIPVLNDLADDVNFSGRVIVAYNPTICAPSTWQTQQEYCDHYHRIFNYGEWINLILNEEMSIYFQSRFALARSASPDIIAKELILHQRMPLKSYYYMRPDRHRPSDYFSKGEKWLDEHRKHRIDRCIKAKPPENYDDIWANALAMVKNDVKKIESRGGQVVFVRMPTTGKSWEIENAWYPRSKYWNQLKQNGLKTIHFKDYPELSKYECPDTSHLNYDDAQKFSRSLIRILKKQGF